MFFIPESQTAVGKPAGKLQAISAIMAGAAMMLYIGAATLVGITVFARPNLEQTTRERWKRSRTHDAFTVSRTMLVPRAFMVFVKFIAPTVHTWYQQAQDDLQNPAADARHYNPEKPAGPAPEQSTGSSDPKEQGAEDPTCTTS